MKNASQLSNKLILITGASQGIGAATAKALGNEGAHVILLARTQDLLEQIANEIISAGGNASVFTVDLANVAATTKVMSHILSEFGPPDVLIHNAGSGDWFYTEETPIEQLDQFMALPFAAAFRITHALLPAMLQQNNGQIIFINSPASEIPWAGASAYIASRWALRGYNKALAIDLRNTGICVTSIIPGQVDSNYFANNPNVLKRLPKNARYYPVQSTQQVATAIIKAIKCRQSEVILPWLLRLTFILHNLMPKLVEWMAKKASHQKIYK